MKTQIKNQMDTDLRSLIGKSILITINCVGRTIDKGYRKIIAIDQDGELFRITVQFSFYEKDIMCFTVPSLDFNFE